MTRLTGRQIREALTLLGMKRSILAQKVGRITTLAIMRAEESEDEPILSAEQDAAVRQTLERLGGLRLSPVAYGCKSRNRDA